MAGAGCQLKSGDEKAARPTGSSLLLQKKTKKSRVSTQKKMLILKGLACGLSHLTEKKTSKENERWTEDKSD